MKKVLSFLLVAMLVVTCFATVVSAAGSASAYVSQSQTVTPGQTVTLTVGISGDEFANYQMTLGASAGLTIVSIDGVVNYNNNVAWASNANVTSHAFTVTVKVAEDAQPGDYYVTANVTLISDKDLVDLTCSNASCTLTIEEPKCDHEWDEGEVTTPAGCETTGVMTYTCIKCGETKTETIAATGHDWTCGSDWDYVDGTGHFHDHICADCGTKIGDTHKEIHTMVPYKDEVLENGDIKYYRACAYCGYTDTKIVEPGTPPTGDITTVLSAGSAAIFASMMSVVALVVKRKTV